MEKDEWITLERNLIMTDEERIRLDQRDMLVKKCFTRNEKQSSRGGCFLFSLEKQPETGDIPAF